MDIQELYKFFRLVRTTITTQQMVRADSSMMKKALALEHRVDKFLHSYNYHSPTHFDWQHRFVKVVLDARITQVNYLKSKTYLNKTLRDTSEKKLNESIAWVINNYYTLIYHKPKQTSIQEHLQYYDNATNDTASEGCRDLRHSESVCDNKK